MKAKAVNKHGINTKNAATKYRLNHFSINIDKKQSDTSPLE
jgi:hypothetical protein